MDYTKWNTKWKDLDDPAFQDQHAEEQEQEQQRGPTADEVVRAAYAREQPGSCEPAGINRLRELKLQMAMEVYERRRPTGEVMHHYCVKEAGDAEALGEYLPTKDSRNSAPVYQNSRGMVLSLERQPPGPEGGEETYGWIIGSMHDRRPLYGVRSRDLSAPVVGWQAFTAPEPVPVIRYYSQASAARTFKERGNRAFHERKWAEADVWYSKSLGCRIDPAVYPEALAMVRANRAEARLRSSAFEDAAQDAQKALTLLSAADNFEEPMQMLKQKVVVRLAKAQLSLRRFNEALQLLEEQCLLFPKALELRRLLEETRLALRVERPAADAAKGLRNGASAEMLGYLRKIVDSVREQVEAPQLQPTEASAAQDLQLALKRLEYLLLKARGVQNACLADLQAAFRSCGGLRLLLGYLRTQWKLWEGRALDTYAVPAAALAASAISLACDACTENLKVAAEEASIFLALLGGCNRRVDAHLCEHLVLLVANLWQHCAARDVEIVHSSGLAVERAASFLSQVALVDIGHDQFGLDAPALPAHCKEQAVAVLHQWLQAGGRLESRALRGTAPQLAGPEGFGFFTGSFVSIRALGDLVASKVVADPSLLSAGDVQNLLLAVSRLQEAGPFAAAAAGNVATASYQEFGGEGAVMRYADLEDWAASEEGGRAALLLRAVAGALEYRLLLKSRELERESFVEAFHAGLGFFLLIPLIQAPLAFAESALLCLSALVQMSVDHGHYVANLSGLQAIFGLPSPESQPIISRLDEVLKRSLAARCHAAKLLSRCIETDTAVAMLQGDGQKAMKGLVRLTLSLLRDGASALEALHDMLHVFYVISQHCPGPLCQQLPEEMMHLFVDLASADSSSVASQGEVADRARAVLHTLLADKACKRVLRAIIEQHEDGTRAASAEGDLLKVSDAPGVVSLGY